MGLIDPSRGKYIQPFKAPVEGNVAKKPIPVQLPDTSGEATGLKELERNREQLSQESKIPPALMKAIESTADGMSIGMLSNLADFLKPHSGEVTTLLAALVSQAEDLGRTSMKKDKNKTEDGFDQAVEGLTTAIVETLKDDYQNDYEPFEAYAQRVRRQVIVGLGQFNERFLQGYQALLSELGDQKKE